MKEKTVPLSQIAIGLMAQVKNCALSHLCPESEITTFITYEMWKKWDRATKHLPGPSDYILASQVKIIYRQGLASFSVHSSKVNELTWQE